MNKIIIILLLLLIPFGLYSQDSTLISVNTGLDVVSSYNWRAIDYGNSPALQPYIGISAFGFDFSVWGSYALIANEKIKEKVLPFTEIDLILKYSFQAEFGTLYSELVDFYYPYLNMDYSNYDGVEDKSSTGAHWISWAVGYKGTESFPISLKLDYNIHNDPDNSIYFETGYNLVINKTPIDIFLGFAKGKEISGLYSIDNDKIALVNFGATVSKSIKITDDFSLPISTQFVVNPRLNKAFLVFKVTL